MKIISKIRKFDGNYKMYENEQLVETMKKSNENRQNNGDQ